ncbi:hypothetical protein KY341_01330 [Candidatus Woesearchaeota archaeon]|nr:hypothetical protein [Candidatus Woesearchaeota archaeon]
MKKILIPLVLVFVFLPVFISAQVASTPSIGSYSDYGDDFLYLVKGGYAELTDADVNDIDYSTTSFSVEAIADARVAESRTDWNGILLKGHRYVLWDASIPGWGLGFYRSNSKTVSYSLYAKVGDGTQQISLSNYFVGMAHVAMTWDHTSKTLELFVNGVSVKNNSNPSIVLSNIDTSDSLLLGRALGDSKRNILMARWWNRKLSNSDITNLYSNWANNGDDRVPSSVSRTGLHSEWLMNEESDANGNPGAGYLKDNAGNNHLQLMGNARLELSNSESLTLIYPVGGASGVDKSVTLKASGGDADIPGGATHPLLYFFQVDTSSSFNSANLKESGWISHYSEHRPFLAPSTRYYWRVKVRDVDGDESSYTPTWSFTTQGASTWYVRPEGGSYGNEDGTSYANAWDGLQNIVFNETGVEPGDELYVCGLHYHTVTNGGSIGQQGDIILRSGGTEKSPYRITLRGDCHGNQGIVWEGYKIGYPGWVNEGRGVYSIGLHGTEYPGNYFQDVGVPNDDSYILLNRSNSFNECQNNPGSFFMNDSRKVYIHTTYSGDPTGRVWGNRWGYEFNIPNNNHYITFKNLKFYSSRYGFRPKPNITHLRWENCTLWYGESTILEFGDGNHHMEILDCDIGYSGTPIYLISGTSKSPSNYVFARNTVHDCGTLNYHRVGDNHAIGIQGGDGGLIEDNHIYHCRDGIVYYIYPGMHCSNNIIRRNYIHDIYDYGYMPNGISFGANYEGEVGDTSGNMVYDNIIVNVTRAFYYKWPGKMKVYNNVIYNVDWAFNFGGTNKGQTCARAELRNNIAMNVSEYFIRFACYGAPGSYEIDSDYNIFYPILGAKFYFREMNIITDNMTFEEWKALSKPDCVFDPHTLTANPLFINPLLYNFHLHPGSPAIDMGIDVGLTSDFEDTPIPQGTRPDIGAFEYIIGTGCGVADLNCDGSVDIFDLIIVASNFGLTSGFDERADKDDDGQIDILDIVFVASRFI